MYRVSQKTPQRFHVHLLHSGRHSGRGEWWEQPTFYETHLSKKFKCPERREFLQFFNTLNYCKKTKKNLLELLSNFDQIIVKFSQQPRHILGMIYVSWFTKFANYSRNSGSWIFEFSRILRISRNICYTPGCFWVTMKISLWSDKNCGQDSNSSKHLF